MPGSTLKFFSLLLTLGAVESLKSQIAPHAFEHISLEHGLSQATVYAILQDARGFMRFGTQDGLSRFDGYNFVIYRHSQTDSNSLPDNWIWCLYEDRFTPGVLWIGTQNGLSRFDGVTNRFATFKHDPQDGKSLSADFVRSVFPDQSDNLWIGTHLGGLNKFDLKPKKFWHYRHDPSQAQSLQNDFVNAIHESPEGMLWIGTNTGVDKLERDGKAFQHLARLSPETPSARHL